MSKKTYSLALSDFGLCVELDLALRISAYDRGIPAAYRIGWERRGGAAMMVKSGTAPREMLNPMLRALAENVLADAADESIYGFTLVSTTPEAKQWLRDYGRGLSLALNQCVDERFSELVGPPGLDVPFVAAVDRDSGVWRGTLLGAWVTYPISGGDYAHAGISPSTKSEG